MIFGKGDSPNAAAREANLTYGLISNMANYRQQCHPLLCKRDLGLAVHSDVSSSKSPISPHSTSPPQMNHATRKLQKQGGNGATRSKHPLLLQEAR